MTMRRILLLLLLLLIAIAITLSVYLRTPSTEPTLPQIKPIRVETAPVQQINSSAQTNTVGTLKSHKHVEISASFSGKIKKVFFQSGKTVKKGALLIELDDSILQSELAAAQVSLEYAESQYNRIKELALKRMSSAQALDEAYASYKEKKTLVAIKKAQLRKMQIRAPFPGTLGSRNINEGQYVTPGQPLIKLTANQTLRIEYTLPERYLSDLALGQRVSILSDVYPNKSFEAKVSYIAPTVNEDTRSISIEAKLNDAKGKLAPGLFVRINHQFGTTKNLLLVPEESLIPTINGQKLFVFRNGKAQSITVKTGEHHAAMTEITDGLERNARIIVRGQHKLKDGSIVVDVQKG